MVDDGSQAGWVCAIDMGRWCLVCRPTAGDVRAGYGVGPDDERFVVRPVSARWASAEAMGCDQCGRRLTDV